MHFRFSRSHRAKFCFYVSAFDYVLVHLHLFYAIGVIEFVYRDNTNITYVDQILGNGLRGSERISDSGEHN